MIWIYCNQPKGIPTFSSSDIRQHAWCIGATHVTDTSLFPVTTNNHHPTKPAVPTASSIQRFLPFYCQLTSSDSRTLIRHTRRPFGKGRWIRNGKMSVLLCHSAAIRRTSATIPRPHFGAATLFWDPKQAQKGSVIMILQSSHLELCSKYHREWRSVQHFIRPALVDQSQQLIWIVYRPFQCLFTVFSFLWLLQVQGWWGYKVISKDPNAASYCYRPHYWLTWQAMRNISIIGCFISLSCIPLMYRSLMESLFLKALCWETISFLWSVNPVQALRRPQWGN